MTQRDRSGSMAGCATPSDGSVEAVFSGPPAAVEEMLRRCADGPPDAKVTAVTIIDEGGAPPAGFKVIASDRWR